MPLLHAEPKANRCRQLGQTLILIWNASLQGSDGLTGCLGKQPLDRRTIDVLRVLFSELLPRSRRFPFGR